MGSNDNWKIPFSRAPLDSNLQQLCRHSAVLRQQTDTIYIPDTIKSFRRIHMIFLNIYLWFYGSLSSVPISLSNSCLSYFLGFLWCVKSCTKRKRNIELATWCMQRLICSWNDRGLLYEHTSISKLKKNFISLVMEKWTQIKLCFLTFRQFLTNSKDPEYSRRFCRDGRRSEAVN